MAHRRCRAVCFSLVHLISLAWLVLLSFHCSAVRTTQAVVPVSSALLARVSGFGFRVSGSWFRVSGLGYSARQHRHACTGLGFRV